MVSGLGAVFLVAGALGILGLALVLMRRRSAVARSTVSAAEVRERLRPLLRPAARLSPSEPGRVFSKLGGTPDLPTSLEWPIGDLEPRAFLAQIDLAELHAQAPLAGLPLVGRLFAFHDSDRTGAADCVKVLYCQDAATSRSASTSPLREAAWRERSVRFEPFVSPPPPQRVGLADFKVLEDGEALWPGAESMVENSAAHQIGGWPEEIQSGGLEEECERLWRREHTVSAPNGASINPSEVATSWRLLLQIDSDEDLGMNWGDGGRLFIFARDQDTGRGDFSQTVTIWQSY